MKVAITDIGADLSHQELLTAYRASEIENSNLRRILLWAAQHLNREERTELRNQLNAKMLDGGISVDPSEDEAIRDREFLNLIESVITSHDRMLTANTIPTNSAHMLRLCKEAKTRISSMRRPSLAFHRIER